MSWIFSSCLCWLLHSLKRKHSSHINAHLLREVLSTRCSHGHLNTFCPGQLRAISQYTGEFILALYSVKCFGRRALWKFNVLWSFVTPTNMAILSGFRVLDTQTKEHSYPWTHEHMLQNDLQLLMIFLNAVQTSPVPEPSLKPKYFFVIAKFNPVSTETYAWRHIALLFLWELQYAAIWLGGSGGN